MKGRLRDFLFFTRSERRKTLLLLLLLLFIGIGKHYLPRLLRLTDKAEEQQLLEQARQEYAAFKAGLQEKRTQAEGELFPFDPNQVDSVSLRRLGLPDWMARNLLRYRSRGGKFRRPEEFRKLYGMTDEQYARLLPYIRIAPPPERHSSTTKALPDTTPRLYQPDTTAHFPSRPEKYPAGTLVQLNQADTTELQRIPGIGSVMARLIVSYRQQLGGYYHIDQLREIRINSQLLQSWLQIDTTHIRRLYINKESLNGLKRHPYLHYHQAQAIIAYRRQHGPIRHLQALSLLEEFTSADLERLSHYVSFATE